MPILLLVVGAALIGHAVGKSSAQERVHALQTEILKLVDAIEKRDAQIALLCAWRAQVEHELATVRRQRRAFSGFAGWVTDEHPEVVARYQLAQQLATGVGLLQLQGASDRQKLTVLRQQLQ